MTADYRTSVIPSYITRTSGGTHIHKHGFVDIQKKPLSVIILCLRIRHILYFVYSKVLVYYDNDKYSVWLTLRQIRHNMNTYKFSTSRTHAHTYAALWTVKPQRKVECVTM